MGKENEFLKVNAREMKPGRKWREGKILRGNRQETEA